MNLSKTKTIFEDLQKKLNLELTLLEEVSQPYILFETKDLLKICQYIYTSPTYYFDLLNCITGIDNGVENGKIDIIYHFTSIPFGVSLILKTQIDRTLDDSSRIDSVSALWKTADWHEREIFDFFGVKFNTHPDLRRILLPADWEGHPMRKDYEELEKYHGIKVKY
ncbi:NADH-quinone oxidoreductase subunit C [Lacihabitans sp. LS3-19]|uniref:NADH-quinone oxidoreductase subunit C n=1 Tax=Lacihabitans sp. LS3-19 TaxID=2487335 RepID=UPI0020CC9583|nr:NADH-quinone oxidoreductase subunit C [Lacihabitans sp. LS3-19]MCP9767686.1 NADH-quinone oxidoreductase subunit C [Lacihabitans sp. LS3-19]